MTSGRGAALLSTIMCLACDGPQSALDPHGPAAQQIGVLTWVMFGMGAAVSILVFVVLGIAVWRRPREDPQIDPGERTGVVAHDQPRVHARGESPAGRSAESRALKWVLLGGALLPLLVITPLFFYTVTLHGTLLPSDDADLIVEIEGRQWWWVVRYLGAGPQLRVTSANELHIPVGRRVQVRLTSRDVIHSLWVPSLQGKTDMIPGRPTVTWLEADRPGVYRGQCAEYCGMQHAHMAIDVIAHEPAEFDAWLARERLPSAPRPADSGYEIFLQRGCGVCHTVRGTPARGTIGPDLTHVASRRSLAAGTLPNTRGNLAGWITNPQVLKPGNRMPRVPLTSSELHLVVGYLESLR